MPRPLLRLLPLAVLLSVAGCSRFMEKPPAPVPTGFVTATYPSVTLGQTRTYGVYVPPKYNESKAEWPLLLFLHGYGECGDDVNKVDVHGPVKEAMTRGDFPFIVVAPQHPKIPVVKALHAWRNLEPDLLRILEDVRKTYRIDATRTYLTGISMGGFGSFAVSADHPGMFAAVVPICGGGDPARVQDYAGTPFWIFHGVKDRTVPVKRSTDMVESMKAAGQNPKLTLYPDADHDSWTETYKNDEVYEWMLSHQLPETK